MIIKSNQLINIQNGKWWINLCINQKVPVNDVSIKDRVWIQSACKAIYGPTIKLRTVIGIKMIKYNFSVDVRVPKDTCIVEHEYISQINPANNNKIKVSCPADKKFAKLLYEIQINSDVGDVINHNTHWLIKFQKAKHVIPAK